MQTPNTFPVNHAEVITYPSTGDRVLDEEAFRKWQLIRLSEEFGGAANDASAFWVYSNVCLHLGVCGSIIQKAEKEANVLVMQARMILYLGLQLGPCSTASTTIKRATSIGLGSRQ